MVSVYTFGEHSSIQQKLPDEDQTVRVLIADTQSKVRWALHLVLKHTSGVSIVGEASDTEELQHLLARQQADILLLDWELQGSSGAAILAIAQSLTLRPNVLVLSEKIEMQHAALLAGADAFVCKRDLPERFLMVLNQLCATIQKRKRIPG
jgi:two-component system, NarL family, invasion response regulator UvrY